MVTTRQRPQTASGVTFVTMEDEHGPINVIVWAHVAEHYRRALLESRLLGVHGQWQSVENVHHLVAHRLVDLSAMLGTLRSASRDFQ
jgi:error-prone DNA polymerase